MKVVFNIIFLIISISFGLYLLLPLKDFPANLSGSLVSMEPADVESVDRRGYFTDFSRDEVIQHYSDQFSYNIMGFRLRPVRLNYPPEESGLLIRDQTRSTFLEELVFPFRESIYINGFEPKEDKDAIVVGSTVYRQKIILKHVKSNSQIRFILGTITVIFSYLFIINLSKSTKHIFSS